MVIRYIENDWLEYQEVKSMPDYYKPCYQDIDADVAMDSKCPECQGNWRYEGYGIDSVIAYYQGEPQFKTQYTHAFLICDKCKIAWSI